MKEIIKNIKAARSEKKAELVLKNANIVNVFINALEKADVAIEDGIIVGIGEYEGETEIDLEGKYLCPGFIDGHIHIESSFLCGANFEKAVLPHGTTAIITDPHEIANVAGINGIKFMMETTENLNLSVYFTLPSCVPSTDLDESGAILEAADLYSLYSSPRVVGLSEVMNVYGTIHGDEKVLQKIIDCKVNGKVVDGHAPDVKGKDLNAYIVAGVQSDHECTDIQEAMEKLKRGQYIMIREGTAAHNLKALLPLFKEPYCQRCMLVTDDKHPDDLLRLGHIDDIIRKAISFGVDPLIAIKMATLVPSQYFKLEKMGAVAPGFKADLLVLSNLDSLRIEKVYKSGKLIVENGKVIQSSKLSIDSSDYEEVLHSFHLNEITIEDLQLHQQGENERVICLMPNELLTTEKIIPFQKQEGMAPGVNTKEGIVKLAVFERHKNTNHAGLGFLGNYPLKKGAVASSIAHDSHNLIVAGTRDEDMVLAANTVIQNQGGLAFVVDGKVLGEVELPIAGLMSFKDAETLSKKMNQMKQILSEYGINSDIDPFMTLAFVSLPVIPKLRLNTFGLIDVEKQEIIPSVF